MVLQKRCPRCTWVLPSQAFRVRRDLYSKSKLLSWCQECRRKDNRERVRRDPEAHRRGVYASNDKLRREFLEAYGGHCTCCGEAERGFLTLEHLNGSGKAHRKQCGGKYILRMLADLRRRGWPKDGYTILCFNCNCAKSRFGSCPHKQALSA